MENLIDKDTLENILRGLWKEDDGKISEHRICYNKALQDVQCEIDSLEVKNADSCWNEEDDYTAERLLGWLDTLVNYIHHDAIVSLDLRRERMKQVEQIKTWLKSLKERYT